MKRMKRLDTHTHVGTTCFYTLPREFIRSQAVDTVGLKRTGTTCSKGGAKGRCRWGTQVYKVSYRFDCFIFWFGGRGGKGEGDESVRREECLRNTQKYFCLTVPTFAETSTKVVTSCRWKCSASHINCKGLLNLLYSCSCDYNSNYCSQQNQLARLTSHHCRSMSVAISLCVIEASLETLSWTGKIRCQQKK